MVFQRFIGSAIVLSRVQAVVTSLNGVLSIFHIMVGNKDLQFSLFLQSTSMMVIALVVLQNDRKFHQRKKMNDF